MRKRLRKKLRRGEFTELGFALRFRLLAPAGSEAALDIMDAFLAEAIEPHGLALYAGGREDWSGFVAAFGRASVTSAQKDSVLSWLRACPSITDARAGPLIDAWHSREDAFELPAA